MKGRMIGSQVNSGMVVVGHYYHHSAVKEGGNTYIHTS